MGTQNSAGYGNGNGDGYGNGYGYQFGFGPDGGLTDGYAISGGGTLLTKDIVNLNNFKRSIYFLKKNSMSFFYLPIDSITGTVSEFPLGALFSKGGYLMAMGTWTIDGGFGTDDYCVFISSEGQAVVYKGTDPSSSTTWALRT